MHYLDVIYSPFSGRPAEGDFDPDNEDPTALFVYYGEATHWGYLNPKLREILGTDEDGLELEPEDLEARLNVDGGIVLRVDTDWSGVNTYGFAPAVSTIEFTPRP
ncbi:hypothetical protein GDN83_08490 [Gordonia jinghuaiqii]|uniref:Uncharacterized protein n=1 Tax=Gordonia jinghuaiqii TaxID=2758710 RepID=A0A7D7LUC0_9ACTN|nr:hypothetical protein [Gordonia jinghuaiqii]MCR5977777.1 hypothetical protein [Gordonia jinghuaiqii]QMT02437.1 hypothetical protein H1R19_04565 [Gordonia jinghuaiqii]